MELDGSVAVDELLEFYVESFGASGAALWVLVEGVGASREGRLFLHAKCFHTLGQSSLSPLNGAWSMNGRAVRLNTPALHRRLESGWDSELPLSYSDALQRLNIDSFVSIPILLRAQSNSPADAVLIFYRQRGWFSKEDYEELQQASLEFAPAYRYLLERAAHALLKDVHSILRSTAPAAEGSANRYQISTRISEGPLNQALECIASHFGFVEATIYLHDPSIDRAGHFGLAAQLWPWSVKAQDHYQAGEGGLGWVLKTGVAVRLCDLLHYAEDRKYYQELYPGMGWADRVNIREEVQRYFDLQPDEIWPLSYVCVPISCGNEVRGALRCCISRRGPYLVDDTTVAALTTAADLIADWWGHLTHDRQERETRKMSVGVVRAIGATARFAIDRVRHPEAVEKIILRILDLCRECVPQADVVQLWIEQQEGDLKLAAGTAGRDVPRRISLSENTGQTKRNAFRNALGVGVVLHTDNAAEFPFALPEFRAACFTVTPVTSKKARGVLLLAATQKMPWPGAIAVIAGALADQLALYLEFHDQIVTIEEAQIQLERSAQQQADLFLDFQHQLRTPMLIVRRSLEDVESLSKSAAADQALSALSTAVRRAATVANNLHLFVELSLGKPIGVSVTRVSAERALERIEEATRGNYSQRALNKRIEFAVRREYPMPLPSIMADSEGLELVVDNVLDNAIKYSYAETSVVVEAGPAYYGREVYFSFRSRGLPLSSAEAPRVVERGYRGSVARLTSPEGGGIGLWIVSAIMNAMAGRLEVIPTNQEGWLELRLYFKSYL